MAHIPSLQEHADRREIEDLLVRYATALDTRDWPRLATFYLPDAVAIYDGLRMDGLDAIVEICRSSLEPLTASQHFLGNYVIEVDGDRATSSCYLHAQHYRAGARGRST